MNSNKKPISRNNKIYDLKLQSIRYRLTRRERDILRRLLTYETCKGIAYDLQISVKTVYNHRHNIMRKLNTYSILGLYKIALKEKFIQLDLNNNNFPKDSPEYFEIKRHSLKNPDI